MRKSSASSLFARRCRLDLFVSPVIASLLLIKRYLIPSDYSGAKTWQLAEWCMSLGANEFTIDFLSNNPSRAADRWEQFDELVRPLALGQATRERMSGRTADDLSRPTERWTLNETSLDALKDALREGLFQYDALQDGWFEDPILYRDGELMLGVLSHEAFAVLRLTAAESEELDAAGFPSHESLPRIDTIPKAP